MFYSNLRGNFMKCPKDCECTGRQLDRKQEIEYDKEMPQIGYWLLGVGIVAIGYAAYLVMNYLKTVV